MPYSNFATEGLIKYSFILQADFGSGLVDITDFLEDVSIIQAPTDAICGLITREIQVRLILPASEITEKWTESNIPVNLTATANNSDPELVFNGFVESGVISDNVVEWEILDNSDRLIHREFTIPTDNFRADDGEFLIPGDFDEGGTVTSVDFRPKPATFNASNNTVACYLKINKNNANTAGRFTAQEMLKALGMMGGYNKDGVFKLKKRPWVNPTSQWDLRNIIKQNSFQNISYNANYSFNSLTVSGPKFLGQSVNIHLNIQRGKLSSELVNDEVTGLDDSLFLSNNAFNDIYFGYQRTPLRTPYINIQAFNGDDSGAVVLPQVYSTPQAYTHSVSFNGSNRWGTTPVGYNFLDTPTGNFSVEVWLRPFATTNIRGYICSNRDASTDRGQGIRIIASQRRIEFVNHGIETVSTATNFFDWNENFCLLVSVNTATKRVQFYKNGRLARTVSYTNNLVASNSTFKIGGLDPSTDLYGGRMQELRVYSNTRGAEPARRWWNRALKEGQLYNISNDAIKWYWRLNETSGLTAFAGSESTANIGFSDIARLSSSPITALRAWDTNKMEFLGSYTNSDFDQKIKIGVYKPNTNPAFVKRAFIMAPGIYKKIDEISATATGFNSATEIERSTEINSFYINDQSYAQTVANNLLSVYNNKKGFYSFKVPIQPRLMVGDIVDIKTTLGEKKAQVLEKTTAINKGEALDTLIVKII